jgi:hypothetical protein
MHELHAHHPQNHSNGLEICLDVAALIENTKDLPAWSGSNVTGWTATFSDAWKKGAEAIMAKHGLDAMSFLGFCKYVRGE